MQQVLPLLPRPESAVDGECYTPEAEAPPLAASTFPNIDPAVLRTVSRRKYVWSYFALYLHRFGENWTKSQMKSFYRVKTAN